MTAAELRSDVEALAVVASRQLDDLWTPGAADADTMQTVLAEALPPLVTGYALAAAAVAADWYDDRRERVYGPGTFVAPVPDAGDRGADALAGWAVGPLYSSEPDWDTARTLLDGGLQKRIGDSARDVVTDAAVQDPAARGWQREATGRSCPFCVMLASRGAVYSRSSADFASHDNCDCYAVPAFDGQPIPVKPYTPSTRTVTDTDRARVRRYLARNNAG